MGNGLATEEIRNFLNELSRKYTKPVKLFVRWKCALFSGKFTANCRY